jgi:hypothetical protein
MVVHAAPSQPVPNVLELGYDFLAVLVVEIAVQV